MKIVAISDTHNHKPELPEGDILIHAGDMSSGGMRGQIQKQLNWLDRQSFEHIIVVAGNHDKKLATPELFNFRSLHYLDNTSIVINGLRIHGSPTTPRFYNWAFMEDRGPRIRSHWDLIPDDTDILITHGPPHGIGDLVNNRHTGCIELLKRVHEVQPSVHIFGHIHEGYGRYVSDEISTYFVNASIMDGQYNPVNAPQVIEWIQ